MYFITPTIIIKFIAWYVALNLLRPLTGSTHSEVINGSTALALMNRKQVKELWSKI